MTRLCVAAALAAAALAFPVAAAPAGCPAAPHPVVGRFDPLPAQGLRVGLALGSGSMHGLAHIGVIQELEARGVDVQVVAGTSVGALVGALWASGLPGDEIHRMSRTASFDELGDFAASFQGLFNNDALRMALAPVFRHRPIESWPRRFGAVATRLADGERRLLSHGDGAIAVQASSAVPVMFRPVSVGGELLADGALVEPVPVRAARDLGADFVIAVDVAYRPGEGEASGITQYAFQALHILVNSLSRLQAAGADVALRLDLHHRMMACGNEALVEEGREAVRRAWPEMARKAAAAPRPAR